MKQKRNKHMGKSLSTFIQERKAESAQFAKGFDEEVARLELAAKIKALRVRHGLSQRELAELSGLRQQSFARLETGRQYPSVQILQRIARALGKRLDVRFVAEATEQAEIRR